MSEELKPVAWRYFDGEGNYEYREDEPSESSVYHAAIYGRKFEPLYLSAVDGGKSEAELATLLPGPYYMDPPDGGSVTVFEQLQRMAKDAERYRCLRDDKAYAPEEYGIRGGKELDRLVDEMLNERGVSAQTTTKEPRQ